MRFRAPAALVAALFAVGLFPGARAAEPTAAELSQAFQRKYEGVRDFSSDFVHSYRGGVLKRQLSERGSLMVKKPGKMRWEYETPERKLFVSDGTKAYFYVPQDKQVIVTNVPADDRVSTAALFLAGKGVLTRDFTATLTEVPVGLPADSRALKLVPRTPQPDYDWLVLALDPATLALRGLATGDAQGGTSTFTFSGLKENVGIADKSFVFNAPRGVDVVTDSSVTTR
jgi:outer membrane lipoprotein carrier protein